MAAAAAAAVTTRADASHLLARAPFLLLLVLLSFVLLSFVFGPILTPFDLLVGI